MNQIFGERSKKKNFHVRSSTNFSTPLISLFHRFIFSPHKNNSFVLPRKKSSSRKLKFNSEYKKMATTPQIFIFCNIFKTKFLIVENDLWWWVMNV